MFLLLFSPCPSKVIISYLQVVSKIISNSVRHSAQMTKDFLTLLLPALLLNIMSLCVDYIFHVSLQYQYVARVKNGKRCMASSKEIDSVLMKVKWFILSKFRIAVSTYHQFLDQFFSPSLFLSGLCQEPPGELLNKIIKSITN